MQTRHDLYVIWLQNACIFLRTTFLGPDTYLVEARHRALVLEMDGGGGRCAPPPSPSHFVILARHAFGHLIRIALLLLLLLLLLQLLLLLLAYGQYTCIRAHISGRHIIRVSICTVYSGTCILYHRYTHNMYIASTCVYMYMCMYMYMYMYMQMYVLCICGNTCVYIVIHEYTYLRVCMGMCTYAYAYA